MPGGRRFAKRLNLMPKPLGAMLLWGTVRAQASGVYRNISSSFFILGLPVVESLDIKPAYTYLNIFWYHFLFDFF